MVVATGAADRQSEPYGAGRLDAVDGILGGKLLGDDAAFAVAAMVALKAGGDALVERRLRQLIARQLLDRELIERQVAVERLDQPIAPPPHRPLAVGLIAIGIGVAGGVEPGGRHPLSVARRGQQPVHRCFVGCR